MAVRNAKHTLLQRMSYLDLLTWLLIWSGPVTVPVNGDYVLQVRTHSYDNPTNRCAECIAANSDTAGCCDGFRVLENCTSNLRCDNYFYYCLRTLGSTGEGCVGGQRTPDFNFNGGSIDFTPDIVLGLLNPLPLNGLTTAWNGVQLYLDVTDLDPQGNADDLVDRFLIDTSTSDAPVGFETPRTEYHGTFGFATVELSFLVVCAVNYYGPDCSRFCEQNCACDPGFTGEFCQSIDDCFVDSCPDNSLCVDGINSFDCMCNTGFTGAQCEVNIDDCVGAPCSGNGNCTDDIDSFSCTCNPGFTGEFCEAYIDECLTMTVNCSGNGDCVDEVNSYSCTCDPGFTGDLCEININDCVGIACSGNGFCNDRVNTFACVCNTGFTGPLCETNINDCVSGVNCSGNGQCEDGVDSFTCVCDPGFTGELCSIIAESQRGSGSNAGAIAGGIIGALVVLSLLILVVIIVVLLVLKRQRTENFTNKTGPALPGDNPVYDTTADPNNIISLTVTPSSATAEYANINVSSTIGSTADHEFVNPIYGSPADSKPSSAPVYANPNEQDHEFDNPIYTTPGSESAAVVYASPDQGTYEYFSESVTNGHSGDND